MESKYILAYKLRKYRKEKHLTQVEFAKQAGISVRCCGKLERCEVEACLGTLDKLADAIGLTPSELLASV